jgi:hypothetical protein
MGRSGAGACTTVSQLRQAYLERGGLRAAAPEPNPASRSRFPDDMQRAAAVGTSHIVDIEPYMVAWQMVRERLAMGGPFGSWGLAPRAALMGTGDIAVEVFKPKGELVGIETLGIATKLRALQLA